jgi:diacylglycerol kinase (ATP)
MYSHKIITNSKENMNKKDKWVFIINPVAGNGFATNLVEKLKEMISKSDLEAEIVYTTKKGHATELSKQYSGAGYKYIIGVGGDGTLNEIAIPLINNLDVIIGFPGRFEEQDWEIFFKQNVILMDVGQSNGKIFLNGMGLGFDAEVAAENYTETGEVILGGKYKYLWHILKKLLFFKERKMIVYSDGDKLETDCLLILFQSEEDLPEASS